MILSVDPHSGIPVYRQLVDQIRFSVASGQLAAGDEIPSTRALSARLGVNPMTVSKAFGLLEQEGVLERRPGLPHVVRARRNRASRTQQLEQLLRPVMARVRQLELDPDTAVRVFRKLLAREEE